MLPGQRPRKSLSPQEVTSLRLLLCFYFKEDMGIGATASPWGDLGVGSGAQR